MRAISVKDCVEGILMIKENLEVADLWESCLCHNNNICINGEFERLTKERDQLKASLFTVFISRT
jgi:hypothetical protein